jgi:hypothetical protein
MRKQILGAHASIVLAIAFCHRGLFIRRSEVKFVAAQCRNQHATGMRSSETRSRFG